MNKSLRVLLADINDNMRSSFAGAMREAGDMELLAVATTGRETLRLCEQLQPDVLLLELILPELDGLGVLRELNGRTRKPLVIVLTGFATPLAVIWPWRRERPTFSVSPVRRSSSWSASAPLGQLSRRSSRW